MAKLPDRLQTFVRTCQGEAAKICGHQYSEEIAIIVYSKGFEGLDELTEQAKSFLAPLPINYNPNLKSYSSMLEMPGAVHQANENFPKAQAVKDATMAYFILESRSEGNLFLHFNGTYHSDNYEGIYWYLKQQAPDLKIITLTTVSQKDISSLDNEFTERADYIICVDEDMTPGY